MEFSEKLRKYRLEKNMTQEQLGASCGVTCRTIQTFESGKRYPQFEVLKRISDALEVSPSELMGTKTPDSGSDNISAMEHAQKLCALMAGGNVPDEDKDAILKMVTLAYSHAEEANKVRARASRKAKAEE